MKTSKQSKHHPSQGHSENFLHLIAWPMNEKKEKETVMKTRIEHPENIAQTQLDNRMAKSKPVKMGWSAVETEKICTSLNDLLANYSVHYQKLRNYHWNVKGPEFFDLHTEFESQYTQALEHIDDIAERIRIFGKAPLSTLKEYLEISEIKETSSQLDSDIMVRELLGDYRILLARMFAVVDVSMEISDSGTEEMVKLFINRVEKHHWMLSAFLANA